MSYEDSDNPNSIFYVSDLYYIYLLKYSLTELCHASPELFLYWTIYSLYWSNFFLNYAFTELFLYWTMPLLNYSFTELLSSLKCAFTEVFLYLTMSLLMISLLNYSGTIPLLNSALHWAMFYLTWTMPLKSYSFSELCLSWTMFSTELCFLTERLLNYSLYCLEFFFKTMPVLNDCFTELFPLLNSSL